MVYHRKKQIVTETVITISICIPFFSFEGKGIVWMLLVDF